jgi:acyl-CoA dehydrogenase
MTAEEFNRDFMPAPARRQESAAFTFEDQELFRRDARRFVEAEVCPSVDQWERNEEIPRSFWRRLGDLGYLGLEYPEAYGGSGSGFTAKRIFLEELSRCRAMSVALTVSVHTDMSTTYILELGSEEQRQKYLPPLIRGEKVCGVAITEPGAGSDVAGIRTQVRSGRDTYILNGSKTFITNGVYGDVFVVAARSRELDPARRSDGISLFIVERGTKGFSTSRKLEKLGWWASDTAELSFEDCEIPAINLLGEKGEGFEHLMRNLQRERLVIAVVACASAHRALEDTLEYARERRAFGELLGHFQALRHRIADMAALVEVASTFVCDLAQRFESGSATDSLVSMGKLFATDVANEVADTAVQVFGGYGCMREFRIERFFRDARILKIAGGSSEILREIIARRLQLR